MFSSSLISNSSSNCTVKILANQQVSLLLSLSGLLFPQTSNYAVSCLPFLSGIFSRLVHSTEICDTKSCAGLLRMLVKHFTSTCRSAPSGLYFCQKTLGLFLCSARAKLGLRPVGTALKEIGCSTCAAALQRHSVHSQNPPPVRATYTGNWEMAAQRALQLKSLGDVSRNALIQNSSRQDTPGYYK